MGEDWSRKEVEAIVADYFDMWDKELRGMDYSKAEHRHHLARFLNGRSKGAIEYKHQNISAILIELGFLYIAGYIPFRNYQQLLYDIGSSRLDRNHTIVDVVKTQVVQPVSVPDIDDILAVLYKPPTVEPLDHSNIGIIVREPSATYSVNYLEQEANNQSLGLAGEQFVVRFEQARLAYEERDDLASKVKHNSATHGDSSGSDVLSFETTGRERLIEVKTTAYGKFTPFFVTKNEV
ncbi:DUF3883 domain-containing protein, partial [Chloroflexota bacterium]